MTKITPAARVAAAAVAVLLVLSAIQYSFAANANSAFEIGKNGVLYIKTADELAAFSRFCRYDANSRGLAAELASDINLRGAEFEPIPIFCGSFDGTCTERFAKFPMGTYTKVSGCIAATIALAVRPSMIRLGFSKPFMRASVLYGSDFGHRTGTMS